MSKFANFKMHICAILKIQFDAESLILYLILTLELRIYHSLTPIKDVKDLQISKCIFVQLKNTIRFRIIDFVFNTDFRIANFPLLNSNKKCQRFANFKMHNCAIIKIQFDSESLIVYLILTLELRISHSLTPIKNVKNLQISKCIFVQL